METILEAYTNQTCYIDSLVNQWESAKSDLFTFFGNKLTIEKQFSEEETKLLLDNFEAIHVEYWNYEYVDPFICDGTQWELALRREGSWTFACHGSNEYPENWGDLLLFFGVKDQ